MSEKVSSPSAGGIGFVGLLTIVFIVLKLAKVITWGWFWVLSPVIFSIIGIIIVLLVLIGVALWVSK